VGEQFICSSTRSLGSGNVVQYIDMLCALCYTCFLLESEHSMAHPPPLGPFSTQPVFNTKAVARETGVPPDTFRAWERRYGLPRPQRTEGGHRLYSDRDIAIIRWLRDRTAEGMNISQAVQLLKRAVESGSNTAEAEARPLDRLCEDLVVALTNFDTPYAERLISEAFALYPFETVLIELIQPAMVEIGERWHRSQINVATEHFATQFVRRKLAGLLNVFEGSAQRATIVLGCAPDELHDLGILMIALFLARRGWHIVYLGAQVPLNDLIETVQTLKPALVCMSASSFETAAQLGEAGRALRDAAPEVLFGYGGRVFNIHAELRKTVEGTFLGHDARELAENIVRLRLGATSEPVERT
jgi:MerR family transcriptional regulator, light-induced transcriptional regulator